VQNKPCAISGTNFPQKCNKQKNSQTIFNGSKQALRHLLRLRGS
jgi:hypothetical protein